MAQFGRLIHQQIDLMYIQLMILIIHCTGGREKESEDVVLRQILNPLRQSAVKGQQAGVTAATVIYKDASAHFNAPSSSFTETLFMFWETGHSETAPV